VNFALSPYARKPALIAIASGKGGTGKTFVATSLAQVLARDGIRVLLFDGDLGLSNVTVQLGLTQDSRFGALLAGTCAAHDAAVPFQGGAKKRGGFDVLAGPPGSGAFAQEDTPTILRTVAALRLSAGYDVVIIDLGAGVDQTVLRFAGAADSVLAVLTPDPSALTDAYAFLKLHARSSGRAASFLVNQVENAREAQGVADALCHSARVFLDVEPGYAGYIRHDPKAIEAIKRQIPLFTHAPQSTAAADLAALADRLFCAETTHADALR
jgi:flagellar biosynthesis protein FlhG